MKLELKLLIDLNNYHHNKHKMVFILNQSSYVSDIKDIADDLITKIMNFHFDQKVELMCYKTEPRIIESSESIYIFLIISQLNFKQMQLHYKNKPIEPFSNTLLKDRDFIVNNLQEIFKTHYIYYLKKTKVLVSKNYFISDWLLRDKKHYNYYNFSSISSIVVSKISLNDYKNSKETLFKQEDIDSIQDNKSSPSSNINVSHFTAKLQLNDIINQEDVEFYYSIQILFNTGIVKFRFVEDTEEEIKLLTKNRHIYVYNFKFLSQCEYPPKERKNKDQVFFIIGMPVELEYTAKMNNAYLFNKVISMVNEFVEEVCFTSSFCNTNELKIIHDSSDYLYFSRKRKFLSSSLQSNQIKLNEQLKDITSNKIITSKLALQQVFINLPNILNLDLICSYIKYSVNFLEENKEDKFDNFELELSSFYDLVSNASEEIKNPFATKTNNRNSEIKIRDKEKGNLKPYNIEDIKIQSKCKTDYGNAVIRDADQLEREKIKRDNAANKKMRQMNKANLKIESDIRNEIIKHGAYNEKKRNIIFVDNDDVSAKVRIKQGIKDFNFDFV